MAAPRKYPEELRERAIRLTLDARQDPASGPGGVCRTRPGGSSGPWLSASSRWAWMVGRCSMVVKSMVQDSQMVSSRQSSSMGRPQWPGRRLVASPGQEGPYGGFLLMKGTQARSGRAWQWRGGLEVSLGPLDLANPIMPASGCYGPELGQIVSLRRGPVDDRRNYDPSLAGWLSPADDAGRTIRSRSSWARCRDSRPPIWSICTRQEKPSARTGASEYSPRWGRNDCSAQVRETS